MRMGSRSAPFPERSLRSPPRPLLAWITGATSSFTFLISSRGRPLPSPSRGASTFGAPTKTSRTARCNWRDRSTARGCAFTPIPNWFMRWMASTKNSRPSWAWTTWLAVTAIRWSGWKGTARNSSAARSAEKTGAASWCLISKASRNFGLSSRPAACSISETMSISPTPNYRNDRSRGSIAMRLALLSLVPKLCLGTAWLETPFLPKAARAKQSFANRRSQPEFGDERKVVFRGGSQNRAAVRAAAKGLVISGMLLSVLHLAAAAGRADGVDPRVLDAQAKRIAVIEKIRPSVVAIFASGGQGGGSGVLISKDGYALTNFHVVQGSGPVMQCGLPDGVLYDAVLVGLDKVGDVALIKLLPQKEGKDFPVAVLGDSDKVKAGDWSLAMGNPFLLATDFTPTVTYGLVSGVHRYQYPESSRGLLEYTDCIQVDTSINPGNSGGPLFNMDGELIGINGRGSFDKRGRVNSGVGYAISINQIKNFMGHLMAGIDTDHASLGALAETESGEAGSQLVIRSILEEADVARRGLEVGDELVSFAGRPKASV